MPEIAQLMARIYGGKAKLVLQRATELKVKPPEYLLAVLEADLQKAIKIAPSLAEPYWDLAVLNAYRAAYDSARKWLEAATARGYCHPMMNALRKIIDWRKGGWYVRY